MTTAMSPSFYPWQRRELHPVEFATYLTTLPPTASQEALTCLYDYILQRLVHSRNVSEVVALIDAWDCERMGHTLTCGLIFLTRNKKELEVCSVGLIQRATIWIKTQPLDMFASFFNVI